MPVSSKTPIFRGGSTGGSGAWHRPRLRERGRLGRLGRAWRPAVAGCAAGVPLKVRTSRHHAPLELRGSFGATGGRRRMVSHSHHHHGMDHRSHSLLHATRPRVATPRLLPDPPRLLAPIPLPPCTLHLSPTTPSRLHIARPFGMQGTSINRGPSPSLSSTQRFSCWVIASPSGEMTPRWRAGRRA